MKKLIAFFMTAVMVCSMGTTAFGATAYPSNDKISMNGSSLNGFLFYSIEGNNYFKLRDIQLWLSYTPLQFNVEWDHTRKLTKLIPIKSVLGYAGPMSQMYEMNYGNRTAMPTDGKILFDDKEVTLKAYNIDGYNYYKLRDLGDVIGFKVGWNAAAKSIDITYDTVRENTEPAEEYKPHAEVVEGNYLTDAETKKEIDQLKEKYEVSFVVMPVNRDESIVYFKQ